MKKHIIVILILILIVLLIIISSFIYGMCDIDFIFKERNEIECLSRLHLRFKKR